MERVVRGSRPARDRLEIARSFAGAGLADRFTVSGKGEQNVNKLGMLAALSFSAILPLVSGSPIQAASAKPLSVLLADIHGMPLPATPFYRVTESLTPAQGSPERKVTVLLGTPARIQALKEYALEVSTPGSPQYHRFLSPAALARDFGPSARTVEQAEQALRAAGWTVTGHAGWTLSARVQETAAMKVPIDPAIYSVSGLSSQAVDAQAFARAIHAGSEVVSEAAGPTTLTGYLSPYHFRQSPVLAEKAVAANGDVFTAMSFNPQITTSLPAGLPFNLVLSAQNASGQPLAIRSVDNIGDSLDNIGSYGQGQVFPGSQDTLWQLEMAAFGPASKTDTVTANVTLEDGTTQTVSFTLPTFTGTATALAPLTGTQVNQLMGSAALAKGALSTSPAPVAIMSIGQAASLGDVSVLMGQESLPMPQVSVHYEDGAASGALDAATALPSDFGLQALASAAPGVAVDEYVFPTNDSNNPLDSFLTLLSRQSRIKIAEVSYGFAGQNPSVLSTLVDACTAEGITLVFPSGNLGASGGSASALPVQDNQADALTVGGLDLAATATFDNSGTMTSISGPPILKGWGGDYLNGLPSAVLGAYLAQDNASAGGYGTNAEPSWQIPALPSQAPGVGAPDISSLAGMPSFQGVIDGTPQEYGGSSVAAAFSAGWLADLESADGVTAAGMGNINPLLYQSAESHPQDFLQALWGSNGYSQVGSTANGTWNPVTGLGAPLWDDLAQAWLPQPATQLTLTSISTQATIGASVPFTLTAVNQSGNPAPYFIGPVKLSSSDPLAALPGTVRFINGQAIFTVQFGTVGPQTVTVSVPQNPSLSVTSSPISVSNPVTLSVSPGQGRVGEPLTLNASVSLVSSKLRYQFWTKAPGAASWSALDSYSAASQTDFTPKDAGVYQLKVLVQGLIGTPVAAVTSVSVAPAPVPPAAAIGLEVSPPGVSQSAGQTITFHAALPTAVSASPPYFQFWMDGPTNGWKMVRNYSAGNSWTLDNAQPGTYIVAVYVLNKDDLGTSAKAVEYTAVINVASHVALNVPSQGTVGQALAVSAAASGITHPVYQFWIETPSGQWTQSGPYGTAQYQFTPQEKGVYTVTVYSKDAQAPANGVDGVTTSQTVTVQ